jgi:hypothetical protein
MTDVSLPALDGREPLGFLAALGTFRLCAEERSGSDIRLRFDPVTGRAVISGTNISTVDDVLETVETVFERIGDGQIPGLPSDFPPPGEAPDKLRVEAEGVRDLPSTWASGSGGKDVTRWLHALITDLATDNSDRAAITPYAAPSGKQSFSTSFTKTRDDVRRRPNALLEALIGWRRVPGCTGEYLDHRVLVSAADSIDGKTGQERGVPGATWLALMSLPLLPVTGLNRKPVAVGWQLARSRPVLRWPLWSSDLDLACTRALLAHPALTVERKHDDAAPRPTYSFSSQGAERRLSEFGVFGVVTAERRRIQGRNFAGVLVPSRPIPIKS